MMRAQSEILQGEALERLMHATSGHATVADLRDLEAWRTRSAAHADAYRRALGIWESLGTAAREAKTAADHVMIAGQVRAGGRPVGRRAFLIGGAAAAAATVAAGFVLQPPLGLWPSLPDLMADYRTGAGENRAVALADGLSIEMNTRTSIVRRPSDDGEERIELLAGEAAIVAAQNASKSLTTIAADGRVFAARAQANLRNDAGAVHVTCLSGSVQVECGGRTATLRAGEQLAYSPQLVSPVAVVDPAMIMAWKRGLLIFRDEPLAQVLDEVNRYWRGRIVLLNTDLGHRRVTVRIELARIEEVVSYVRSVLGAKVRTLPGGVVILT
ncbi:FecR domain-containing protein [Bradyrhizobium sp. 31Argb]|uniref:FecR family protein n=1 Tax=Bradyrhizobium sp. 31Argb TaxID=3141247 RepID=UPI0037489132